MKSTLVDKMVSSFPIKFMLRTFNVRYFSSKRSQYVMRITIAHMGMSYAYAVIFIYILNALMLHPVQCTQRTRRIFSLIQQQWHYIIFHFSSTHQVTMIISRVSTYIYICYGRLVASVLYVLMQK